AVAGGAVLGQAQIAGTLGRVAFGLLSDRVFGGRRLIVLVLAGAATAGLCAAPPGPGLAGPGRGRRPPPPASGWPGSAGAGVPHPLLAEIAGRDSAATAVGLCLAISSIGVIAGAPLFGLAADRLGGYDWSWYGLALAMLLALALLSGVREPRRPRWA